LLETINWIERYFDEVTDAVFIFKEEHLLVSNQLAKDLEDELNIDPNYLAEVASADLSAATLTESGEQKLQALIKASEA
jgi:two-component system sensor histidine kinase NreB